MSGETLTPLDATFLELEEADDSAHMHIGSLMVFEAHPGTPPSLQRLRALLGRRLEALPRYRHRLSHPHTGGLHWPTWVPDSDFRLEDHVRQAELPPPGGKAELHAWAGDYWSERLDRHRPLWDACLVTGLEGGRWAIATKTHHALVDGVGAADVATLLLDTARRPRRRPAPTPAAEPGDEASGGTLDRVVAGIRGGLSVVRHPGRLRDAAVEVKAMTDILVRDELRPAPHCSLNVPIGSRRRFRAVRADLADVKAIKRELGGTVNDVILAAVAGGLRTLLLERNEPPPPAGLRAMVPVNVRSAGQRLGLGNRVSSLFVHLPVAEPDPARRYLLTVAKAEDMKRSGQAAGGTGLIALAGLAPPVLHSVFARSVFATRLFNLTVTNVPGPQFPLYAFGARMEEVLPLVPLAAGHALGVAVVSYDGGVFFGLDGDERAMPDLDIFACGIEKAIEELRELAATGHTVPALS
ncbi:MAG TPA: wax ester/triacylglycerol synthase family O-acyltransferase [Thermoleophilaceae bacterium]|nr:wax ester/triacylglycerol synthase family O-acyltransferase [Thermoleophilaceae bacterium]